MFSRTFHPTGLGVCAAATWENKQASVRPIESVQVTLELQFGRRMLQALLVLVHIPFVELRIKVFPVESTFPMRRVAKVIDFMSRIA